MDGLDALAAAWRNKREPLPRAPRSTPAQRPSSAATRALVDQPPQRHTTTPLPLWQALAASELSPRELDVIIQIASGHDSSTIARTLLISENTVKSHRVRIFKKLGIHSMAEVGVFAAKAGLV